MVPKAVKSKSQGHKLMCEMVRVMFVATLLGSGARQNGSQLAIIIHLVEGHYGLS